MKKEITELLIDIEQLLLEGFSPKQAAEIIENPLKEALNYHLACGGSFAKFLNKVPIPNLYKTMLISAEQSASLQKGLNFIINTERHKQKLLNNLVKELFYPIIVVFTAFGVLIFFEYAILPVFIDIFKELGTTAPKTIRIIPYIKYSPLLVIFIFTTMYHKKRNNIIPFYNSLKKLFTLKQISLALSNNIPLQEVFTAKHNNSKLQFYLNHGLSLSQILQKVDLLPAKELQKLKIAEKSGKIAKHFESIVSNYENDLLNKIEKTVILIEPLTIIAIGIFIGILTISLIRPIFEIGTLI